MLCFYVFLGSLAFPVSRIYWVFIIGKQQNIPSVKFDHELFQALSCIAMLLENVSMYFASLYRKYFVIYIT